MILWEIVFVLGYHWLLQHFKLPAFALPHVSRLGTRSVVKVNADGSVEETYPASYAVADDPVAHLVFALKYDGVHPQVLHASFLALGIDALSKAIQGKPSSKYLRLLGFWFEKLTGELLLCETAKAGVYVPALDPEKYACGLVEDVPLFARNSRWRVINNLPGSRGWFPIIRMSEKIKRGIEASDAEAFKRLAGRYPAELFRRASNYLYLKETRSSWQIEREQPSADRLERFVKTLHQAGKVALFERLNEGGLCKLQNQIVDARYAEPDFRSVQNFVGETRPDYSERVHYVCPPPGLVRGLMADWAHANTMPSLSLPHPVIHAAVCAFGFVFIHPFEDGNGRLHRYLIHEILQSHGWGLPSLVLPLSATILRRLPEYEAALEAYSKPIQQLARYEFDADNRLNVLNPEVLESSWRWPDLTRQVEFLFETIDHCLREDLLQELTYLLGYDLAKAALRDVVDMPDRKLDLLLTLLHGNGGKLSRNKRAQFGEITDVELQQMELAYQQAIASAELIKAPETGS